MSAPAQAPVRTASPLSEAPSSDIHGIVRSAARRKALVIAITLTVSTATMVVSLLLPKVYRSTAAILPPADAREGSGLGNLMANVPMAQLASPFTGSFGGPSTSDLFMGMLKSRAMADEVIQKFDLKRRFECKTFEATRKRLESDTQIKLSKEKLITITVDAESPQLAADIANHYFAHLDKLNRTVNVTKAVQARLFLEKRLQETKESLTKAEEKLRDFQAKNRAVSLDAQSKAMIDAGASLQAQITASEVQLQVMKGYLSEDNPELMRLKGTVGGLRSHLNRLESGGSQAPTTAKRASLDKVPALLLDYGRLMRDLKVQETVYLMLNSQFEQAKLTEARDTPTVVILDAGLPAEKKIRPFVTLNVLVAGAISGLFASLLAHYLERRRLRRSTVA